MILQTSIPIKCTQCFNTLLQILWKLSLTALTVHNTSHSILNGIITNDTPPSSRRTWNEKNISEPGPVARYISVVSWYALSCHVLVRHSADNTCRPGMIVNTMPVPSPAAARGRVFSVDGDDCRRNCGFGHRATLLLGRGDVLLPLPSRTLTVVDGWCDDQNYYIKEVNHRIHRGTQNSREELLCFCVLVTVYLIHLSSLFSKRK